MDIYSILKYTNKYDHPLENEELFKSIENRKGTGGRILRKFQRYLIKAFSDQE